MALYNSIFSVHNMRQSPIVVGSMTIQIGEGLNYWNTRDQNVPQLVEDTFSSMRDNEETWGSLISLGDAEARLDGTPITHGQFLDFFLRMKKDLDEAGSMTKLLSKSNLRLAALQEDAGQINVVNSPVGWGWHTFFTGRADDLSAQHPNSGRGSGPAIELDVPDGEEGVLRVVSEEFQWNAPIQLFSGEVHWGPNFARTDHFSVGVSFPPSVATSASGDGNANAFDLGGGAKIYLPAEGDGAFSLQLTQDSPQSLTQAVPVPNNNRAGNWDLIPKTGEIVPAHNGQGTGWYDLYNFPVGPAWFIRCVSMIGDRWEPKAFKAQYVHNTWKVTLQCSKTSVGACWIAAQDLLIFRTETT